MLIRIEFRCTRFGFRRFLSVLVFIHWMIWWLCWNVWALTRLVLLCECVALNYWIIVLIIKYILIIENIQILLIPNLQVPVISLGNAQARRRGVGVARHPLLMMHVSVVVGLILGTHRFVEETLLQWIHGNKYNNTDTVISSIVLWRLLKICRLNGPGE